MCACHRTGPWDRPRERGGVNVERKKSSATEKTVESHTQGELLDRVGRIFFF